MPNLFVIKLNYTAAIEKIDEQLVPHRSYLDYCYQQGHYLASGPQIPRSGGIIIAKADSKDQIDILMAQDPFMIHQLATYEVIEFAPVKSIDGIKAWLDT